MAFVFARDSALDGVNHSDMRLKFKDHRCVVPESSFLLLLGPADQAADPPPLEGSALTDAPLQQ